MRARSNRRHSKPMGKTSSAEPDSAVLRATILEVIANQLAALEPPETKQTYDRLVAQGYSDEQARELIGAVVASEIFHVLNEQKSFDNERYVAALAQLPQMPWT